MSYTWVGKINLLWILLYTVCYLGQLPVLIKFLNYTFSSNWKCSEKEVTFHFLTLQATYIEQTWICMQPSTCVLNCSTALQTPPLYTFFLSPEFFSIWTFKICRLCFINCIYTVFWNCFKYLWRLCSIENPALYIAVSQDLDHYLWYEGWHSGTAKWDPSQMGTSCFSFGLWHSRQVAITSMGWNFFGSKRMSIELIHYPWCWGLSSATLNSL